MPIEKFDEGISGMKGELELIFRNKATGEIVDRESDKNIFLNIGMDQMLRSITVAAPAGGATAYTLQSLRIGSDIGSGTLLSPEPAAAGYTSTNQTVVYTAPYSALVLAYPNYFTTTISTVLDGSTVMANYPNDVDLRFSSAALYSGNADPFAYRRFRTRTITREITIDVKWTLYFSGQVEPT